MWLVCESTSHEKTLKGDSSGVRDLCDEQHRVVLSQIQKRNNVRKILQLAVVCGLADVAAMVIGGRFGYFSMNKIQWTVYGLVSSTIMLLFFIVARYLLQTREKKWYRSSYFLFYGILLLQTGGLLWKSSDITIGLIVFLGCILVMGGIPYLNEWERKLFGACLCGLAYGFYVGKQLDWKEAGCIGSWCLLGYWLSKTRYISYMRQIRQNMELKSAVHQAETDPMTGLWNRRGLERKLDTAVPYCIRNRVPVAVLMLDIDYFKRYNDTYGHQMGDRCIRQVAQQIKLAARRKTDVAARVGGEEFFVFLTGVEAEDARMWANRLQESIEALAIPHAPDVEAGIVTISMGIQCGVLQSVEELAVLRRKADEQLYGAKRAGRACYMLNQVCHRSEKMKQKLNNREYRLRA